LRRNLLFLAAVSMILCFTLASTTVQPTVAQPVSVEAVISQISGEEAWQFDAYLASDTFMGRLAGDTGQYLAGDWIASKFGEWGLEPLPDIGGYKQWFPYEFWHAYPPVELKKTAPPPVISWTYISDYVIFSYSGSVNVETEVVFAGYGLTMPAPFIYDDYAGIDVTDKIVLVFRHGPRDDGAWNVPVPGTPFTAWMFGFKAVNAFNHGAVGMILVNDYRHDPAAGSGTLTANGYRSAFGAVWAHRTNVAEALVADLQTRQNQIDNTLTPQSVATGKTVKMIVTTEYDPERPTFNVLGMVPGTEKPNEWIIVGAHYDHLGVGPVGEIYYGADDDASGTACVLELAKVLSKYPQKRTMVFAAWTAEEEGLLGSEYFVFAYLPTEPDVKVLAYINLDMVGKGTEKYTTGTIMPPEDYWDGYTGPSYLLRYMINRGTEVELKVVPVGFHTASDHANFAYVGMQSVQFYWGGDHPGYHTPADTSDLVIPYNLEITSKHVAVTMLKLATRADVWPAVPTVAPAAPVFTGEIPAE